MQTTTHPLAVRNDASLHKVEISLAKEEIAQIAGHTVLSKAVIELTVDESNCLKAVVLLTVIVSDISATCNSHHVKPTIAKLDGRKKYLIYKTAQ